MPSPDDEINITIKRSDLEAIKGVTGTLTAILDQAGQESDANSEEAEKSMTEQGNGGGAGPMGPGDAAAAKALMADMTAR